MSDQPMAAEEYLALLEHVDPEAEAHVRAHYYDLLVRCLATIHKHDIAGIFGGLFVWEELPGGSRQGNRTNDELNKHLIFFEHSD